MNNMKSFFEKINWKLITYLFYAIIAVSFLSTNTFATYSSTGTGTGTMDVAKFYYSANFGNEASGTYQVSSDDDIVIPIEISNGVNGNGSQVALSYSIAVISNAESYTYTISSDDKNTEVSNKELGSSYTQLGDIGINSTIPVVHKYNLTIKPDSGSGYGWEEDATDNIVKIVVLFEQNGGQEE